MAATFPGGVKVFTTKQAGDQIASAHINDLQDEVVAVETELKKTTGSVVDHGSLAGLGDNDHPQYLLSASTNYPRADGWIPVSGTWTYKTATTITVPSGAASIYKVGMGIRLTQSSTVKYFYIVKVENTLLTITGGSDYTLADATISAVSYTNTPATAIGFPNTFNYTPVVTYAGNNTDPTGWTSLNGSFSIGGNIATVMITGQLNRGSGDRTYMAFSPPVAYSSGTAALCVHTIVSGVFRVAPAYLSAGKISVSLDAAMNNNGYIWVNVTYKI